MDGQGQNPFAEILSRFTQSQGGNPIANGQAGPMAQEQMAAAQQQSAMQGAAQGAEFDPATGMPMEEDQTQKGVATGTSKYLIGAIGQLQQYIAQATDRDEIATARSIISLLSRLIDKDQQTEGTKLQQQPQPGMGAGMPSEEMGGGQPQGY